MNHTAKLAMAITASFFIGIASVAVAESVDNNDTASGKMYSSFHQRGMGKFRNDRRIFPQGETLSKEQIQKLEAQRTEFVNATRDIRQELNSKRLALRSELTKKEPDAKTALGLQKEISALNTELEQQRVKHLLEMKKIAPYSRLGRLKEGREGPRGGRFQRM